MPRTKSPIFHCHMNQLCALTLRIKIPGLGCLVCNCHRRRNLGIFVAESRAQFHRVSFIARKREVACRQCTFPQHSRGKNLSFKMLNNYVFHMAVDNFQYLVMTISTEFLIARFGPFSLDFFAVYMFLII